MLHQAYQLREQLTTIFDTVYSKKEGLRRIGFWRAHVGKSGLRCFDGFLKLLDTWYDKDRLQEIGGAGQGSQGRSIIGT